MNQQKLAEFKAEYAQQLAKLVDEHPNHFAWPKSELATVTERMCDAIERGSFNKESIALRRTCKRFQIKHTYKAIDAFLER